MLALAIELDGKSHQRPERVERDKLVNAIFEHVGLRLERVAVEREFSVAIGEMVTAFQR